MGLIDFLKQDLAGKSTESATPDGICPNCWWRQEYEGEFFEAVKAEGIDTNNVNEKHGWVQAYAERNLSGIQLRENDAKLVCNSCQMSYEKA
jgi:hypothetical protein